ncbi:hypothetical protein CAPTEDRAFT_175470 [Capitella teleta]|uniref:RRM domain-containing protein n=1 Tax=Capitella teleta TaxID=283909 RepID=R7V136_CAPTE|nr:hypothetical protein CAPTEDRAFT_175470 [Capitella teleta]|eukprot:ELU12563.1 hypothetical protein CAPTEDRAFT_175470 [Capitella teleta]
MSGRIYVGRLSYSVRERDIERFFRNYGRIVDVLLKNGYGFVEFDDYRDADDAVYELNGKELCGERVVIEHARGPNRKDDRDGGYRDRGDRGGGRGGGRQPGWMDKSGSRYGPPARTEYRLVVENLSSRVSWQDLKDYMRQAGEVTYADAHKQHKNEGIVEFSSRADMKTALEKLDDTEINGRRIRLVEDRSRSRRRSHSRSHSRGRYRSRSPRSRSRSRRRSVSRSRSPVHRNGKSRSLSRDRSVSRGRSKSMDRSVSRDRSKSRDRSVSRDRSKSRDRSVSRDRSKSKSRSKSRSVSPRDNGASPARDDSPRRSPADDED